MLCPRRRRAVLPGCQVTAHGLHAVLNDAVNDAGGGYVEGLLELHGSQVQFSDSGSVGGGLFAAPRSGISGFLQLEHSTVADSVANFGAGLRTGQVGSQIRHITFAAQVGGDVCALYASGVADASSVLFTWNTIFDAPCFFFRAFTRWCGSTRMKKT